MYNEHRQKLTRNKLAYLIMVQLRLMTSGQETDRAYSIQLSVPAFQRCCCHCYYYYYKKTTTTTTTITTTTQCSSINHHCHYYCFPLLFMRQLFLELLPVRPCYPQVNCWELFQYNYELLNRKMLNLKKTSETNQTFQQQQQQIVFGRSRKQNNYKIIKLKLLLTGYQRANWPSMPAPYIAT